MKSNLEDIEEEIGINLDLLLRFLDGCWYRVNDRIRHSRPNIVLAKSFDIDSKPYIIFEIFDIEDKKLLFNVRDIGKNIALTKEELENDN